MLSVSAMSGGQGAYYTGLAREDYYLEGGEPPGVWQGKGAQLLGMAGKVDKEIFAGLFSGMDQKGTPLVQNAGSPDRQPGWDLTFSAPKSVSVLWSLLPAELGAEIRAAHMEGVQRACGYLEEVAGWTRRGHGGQSREKAGLVVGLFEHGTSRAGDPQLHTHALVLNIGVRADGTTGSIESKPLYQHKMAAGALYRSELAMQLGRRLGLEVDRVRSWFEVQGVSPGLIGHWSSRRAEIEAALEKSGFTGAKASEMAALTTRQIKEHVAREELFEQWQKYGAEHGWGTEKAQSLCREHWLKPEFPQWVRDLVVKEAVQEITKQSSHFAEQDLVRKAAENAQGRGIGAQQVLDGVRQYLSSEAICLTPTLPLKLYTTPEMLAVEKKMLEQVEMSRGIQRHTVSGLVLTPVLGMNSHLREEQRSAVEYLVGGPGSIAVVSGMAGTGKTTMLKAAAQAWKLGGYSVKGAALAGKAADGLANEAGIESSTIAKLLLQIEKGSITLTKSTILIVDEAGMVGTLQMARIIEETHKAGSKLVLIGDARQLQPVDAGGPFASIAKRLGDIPMEEIVRQTEGWARQVVHDMADGKADRALEAFAARGLLSITEDKPKARAALIDQWKTEGVKKPEKNLILAATNQDAAILNKEAQALRKEKGALGIPYLKAAGEKFHMGDRLVFTKNSGPRGLRNGQLGTVQSINPITRTLGVRLDSGRQVSVPLGEYSDLKLGYAVTTHKSQGMTTQNAYILTDESMQDKELSYVQASRARGTTRLFTTQLEAGSEYERLSRIMSQSHQKQLATDLQEQNHKKVATHARQNQEQRGSQDIRLSI